MAKHINIKTGKPQLFGRAPLLINHKHSESAKAQRYYQYQVLFYHHYPNSFKQQKVVKPAIQQLPVAVETSFKPAKIKWYELVPHWIVELFTREKSPQEILPSTA